MTKSSMIRLAGAAIILVIYLAALPSCGSGEPETDAAQPQVDPRFASADAFIEHYNELSSATPAKAREQVDLLYAENRNQESMVACARSMIEIAELDWMMRQKFKEGWDPRARHAMLAPSQPARIVRRDDRRAQAEYIDPNGKQQTLQLVQIGDRWWVSGFTLEHDAEWNQMIADWPGIESFSSRMGDAASRAREQINTGKLTTAQSAREVVANELMNAGSAAPAAGSGQ